MSEEVVSTNILGEKIFTAKMRYTRRGRSSKANVRSERMFAGAYEGLTYTTRGDPVLRGFGHVSEGDGKRSLDVLRVPRDGGGRGGSEKDGGDSGHGTGRYPFTVVFFTPAEKEITFN